MPGAFSGNNQQFYEIAIYKETGTDAGYIDFNTSPEGFVLKMDGGNDNIASPLKTTSVEFDFIIETAPQEAILDDILSVATGNENEFSVILSRYDVSTGAWRQMWIGPLLGDLINVQDIGINRIVKVEATDGLTQLKYKTWDTTIYGGMKSLMYIVKACLNQIPLVSARFNATDAFISHTPNYYNKAMSGGQSSPNVVDNDTWRENVNHDPLALTVVNTEVFVNPDGTNWSYYHILEQILSAFQLRIMMTEVESTSQNRVSWLLQSPWIYHYSGGTSLTEVLCFFHGNDLTVENALSYNNQFSTKLLNPNQRMSGGLTTYVPPLLTYKSVYDHKIMQNLIIGPISFNSYQASQDSTTAQDLTIDVGPSDFTVVNTPASGVVEDTEWPMGNQGFAIPGNVRVLITGHATYYPYHWSAWDFYNENNVAIPNLGDWTRAAPFDQYIYWRMGLMMRVDSDWSDNMGSHDITKYFYLGSSRQGQLYGSIPWFGPGETDIGTNYVEGFWGVTWPNEWNYTVGGVTYYPWGTDNGSDQHYWNTSPGSGGTTINVYHFHWFSPMYQYLSSALLGTADSYNGFMAGWGFMSQLTYSEGFAIYSPLIPVVGSQYETFPSFSYIKQFRLYYALKRDMWDNDGSGDYYTCALDWSNQKELLHENRGVGFGCNLDDVRVFIVGNTNYDDGYYDYSIGQYINENGTPSEGEVQDPEIIIGDEPGFLGSFVTDTNEGVQPVYFGQFWIKNTNSATNALEPYYINVDAQKWINSWESLSGDPQKLHIKRCKNQLAHHYKLKQRLDLRFKDRSPGFNSVPAGDFKMTRFGFSGIYVWDNTGDNQTENTEWENLLFMITGGTFTAGTGEWKLQMTDCKTFSQANLVNRSYNSNQV